MATRRLPPAPTAQYVEWGRQALLELLGIEHAITWSEAEAKISGHKWPGVPRPIDPHHMTTARRQLTHEGVICETPATTRGGRSVSLIHLCDLKRRRRAFEDAAARKRLLQARYLGWSADFGRSGELTVHRSLQHAYGRSRELASAGAGLSLAQPDGGEVGRLFGAPVPGGPLDNAALLTFHTQSPPAVITLPTEVKNVRDWIYPDSHRLHQVLYKAAQLQVDNPDARFLPILITRRAHLTTYWMARTFGFFSSDTGHQILLPHLVDEAKLDEVNQELGYEIAFHDGPHSRVSNLFAQIIPPRAIETAARWRDFATTYVDHFERLRRDDLPLAERATLKTDLDAEVVREHRERVAALEYFDGQGDPDS